MMGDELLLMTSNHGDGMERLENAKMQKKSGTGEAPVSETEKAEKLSRDAEPRFHFDLGFFVIVILFL